MSYTHTPVSASVIKSTSRFVAKAVPRKQAVVVPRSTPVPIEETLSESEEDDNDEPLIDALEEDDGAEQTETSAPGISSSSVQSSIPPIIAPTGNAPAPVAVPIPTRSLRSTAATISPIEPTASSATAATTATTRKRQQQGSKDDNARRLRRRTTPPTAEDVVISPSTMKMAEMCIDKRTGRKSSRYAELREAERQRRRLKELNREQEQQRAESTDPAPPVSSIVQGAETIQEEDDTLLPVTLGTARVVTDSEGNIVIDQSSLQVDRHAIHPSTMTDSLIQTTETMFTSKTNSSTYASTRTHASNAIRWLPSDNERFYEALRMFGTDFQTVADYLGGGKDRRHVKNKFYKEEKKNSDKLTWALKNKLPPDVARLAENRGIVFNARDADQVREELAAMKEAGRVAMEKMPVKS
jgi:transcription factor TFIIIB component B''